MVITSKTATIIKQRLKKKMKIEDKAGLPKIRIAVVGQSNVGKSALTVRFLTGRFIGEYRSNTDLLYRQIVRLSNNGGTAADVEIVDVCSSSSDDNEEVAFPEEAALWADAVAIVYSITSKSSFAVAITLLQRLRALRGSGVPVLLVANKADLGHLRRVPAAEGRASAAARGALFAEASAAEGGGAAAAAFGALLAAAGARRKFSVALALGRLVGARAAPPAPSRGSVAPCLPADLRRRRAARTRRDRRGAANSL